MLTADAHVQRVFVPATVIQGDSSGLDSASADESFFVVGSPGQYELPGYLINAADLEHHHVPCGVAWQVAMIVGLNAAQHAILLNHEDDLWELLLQDGTGLPETYTFRTRASTILADVVACR